MNYEIPREYKGLVDAQIAAGIFSSANEFLDALVADYGSLNEEQRQYEMWLTEQANEGIISGETEGYITAEESKASLEAFKAEWRKANSGGI